MVMLKKIFSFIGYCLVGLVFLAVIVVLFIGATNRMNECVKEKDTSYCVMTQQKFVFWDMVSPLSDKK